MAEVWQWVLTVVVILGFIAYLKSNTIISAWRIARDMRKANQFWQDIAKGMIGKDLPGPIDIKTWEERRK